MLVSQLEKCYRLRVSSGFQHCATKIKAFSSPSNYCFHASLGINSLVSLQSTVLNYICIAVYKWFISSMCFIVQPVMAQTEIRTIWNELVCSLQLQLPAHDITMKIIYFVATFLYIMGIN